MNSESKPSPFVVTYANKYGTQKVIPCDSFNEAMANLAMTLRELGFASTCDIASPDIPVLIWMLNPRDRTYEKTPIVPQSQQKSVVGNHQQPPVPTTVNREATGPYALMLWLMFGALVLYNALDAYQTKLLLDRGMTEVNPFLRWLIHISGNWWIIITYKASALALLATVIMYTLEKRTGPSSAMQSQGITGKARWIPAVEMKTEVAQND